MSDLGRTLRTLRESRGLSLPELAEQTRLAPRMLEALEEERFELLPGGFYLKRYLTTYIQALGEEPETFLQNHQALVNRHVEARQEAPRQICRKLPYTRISHRRITALLLALLVLTSAAALWLKRQAWQNWLSERLSPPPPPLALTLTPFPPEPEPLTPLPPPVTLEVKAMEQCWARISQDGQQIFEGILNTGESRTFRGERLHAVLGNPGGLQVRFNGQLFDMPGDRKRSLSLDLPPTS